MLITGVFFSNRSPGVTGGVLLFSSSVFYFPKIPFCFPELRFSIPKVTSALNLRTSSWSIIFYVFYSKFNPYGSLENAGSEYIEELKF